jgi:hypothetical protein
MHDCVGGSCIIDPAGARRHQEGATQAITYPALQHSGETDWILNSSVIRSGHLLRSLYGPIPPAPTPNSIAAKAAQNLAKRTEVLEDSDSGNEDTNMDKQVLVEKPAVKARRNRSGQV